MRTTNSRAAAAFCVGLAVISTVSRGQCPGQIWQSMADLPGVDGFVYAATEWDPDGSGRAPALLVVGGELSAAGNQFVSNIAVWDGAHWSGLSEGLPSAADAMDFNGVAALLADQGDLIAGG